MKRVEQPVFVQGLQRVQAVNVGHLDIEDDRLWSDLGSKLSVLSTKNVDKIAIKIFQKINIVT